MIFRELLTLFFASVGTFFLIVAAIGLNRMPDLYTRMHGTAKSTTLGITGIMLAVAVHFGDSPAVTRAVLVILFFFLTTPIGNHVLARAAYFQETEVWEETSMDELAGRYDVETHQLE